jgi:hypothetical protein
MTKLSKEDWQQLDILLGKAGFGGYYDLIECLRMAALNLTIIDDIKTVISTEKDLQKMTQLLIMLSKNSKYQLSEFEGNINDAEKILKEFPKDTLENLHSEGWHKEAENVELWIKRLKCALCSINKDCSTINDPDECLKEPSKL